MTNNNSPAVAAPIQAGQAGPSVTLSPSSSEETAMLKEAIEIVRAHANMERIRMAQGHNSSDYDAARNAYDIVLVAAWNRRPTPKVEGRQIIEALLSSNERWGLTQARKNASAAALAYLAQPPVSSDGGEGKD